MLKKNIRFPILVLATYLAVNLPTAPIADAVTVVVRSSDWRLQQDSVWGVIYWSDYNIQYGTNYYTVFVGL